MKWIQTVLNSEKFLDQCLLSQSYVVFSLKRKTVCQDLPRVYIPQCCVVSYPNNMVRQDRLAKVRSICQVFSLEEPIFVYSSQNWSFYPSPTFVNIIHIQHSQQRPATLISWASCWLPAATFAIKTRAGLELTGKESRLMPGTYLMNNF